MELKNSDASSKVMPRRSYPVQLPSEMAHLSTQWRKLYAEFAKVHSKFIFYAEFIN